MATSIKKGQIVNRTGLSEVFGVSLPTVDAWVRQGCPYVKRGIGRGQQWEFSTADVAKWLQERAADAVAGDARQDLDEIERRTKRAKMLQAELDLAKARGEVAPISEFERVQAARYALIRANCLNIPGRAVLRLLGETDEATFKRVLREEVVLALETSANAALDLPEDDEDDEPGED